MAYDLNELAPNVAAHPAQRGVGFDLTFGEQSALDGPGISDEWQMGEWSIRFIQLAAGQALELPEDGVDYYPKLVTGSWTGDELPRFAPAKSVRSLKRQGGTLQAGDQGALVALMTAPKQIATITSIDQLAVTGPSAELLGWKLFGESHLGSGIPYFDGLDAYLVPGFHLVEEDGTEIAYVHIWAAGKGVDMSAHDHRNKPTEEFPAFAETHFVLHNGTGAGAMYECDKDDRNIRTFSPMQAGEDHGPFWTVDADTGLPVFRDNGSVHYGFHSWCGGTDDKPGAAYDVVAAFELNPSYAAL